MINPFKQNFHYILVKSCNIAVIVFSIWSFVTLITPTDMLLEEVNNIVLRIIIAILILVGIFIIISLGVTIYVMRRKKVEILDLHSNHKLFIEYGNLFDDQDNKEIKNIVFAGNRCFDTVVDDNLIGTQKIHGVALNRIYQSGGRSPETVSEEIQENLSLHNYSFVTLEKQNKREGNLKRYEAGAVAEIKGLNNEQYFILGLTSFDSKLRAHVDKEDYLKSIVAVVKYISDRSQGFPTFMPVIGSGGADAGDVKELIVQIVRTIEMFKDSINCDIHIIVSEKEDKIGLFNLKYR